MILHWLKNYDKIDSNTLQEVLVDSKHNLYHRGRVIKHCRICKQWVSKEDYLDFCVKGMHEYSMPENIEARAYKEVEAKA